MFGPKGPSSDNTSKITKNRYWLMGSLYKKDISFVQLIGSYWRVTGESIDVVSSCIFCGKWIREYFSSLFWATCWF
jgi:hypothetical protein